MHVKIGFPDAAVERRILAQARGEALGGETKPERRVSQQAIFAARKEILGLYMADAVEEYLVQLVMATRTPAKFDAEPGRLDRLRRQPARFHLAGPLRACPCLAGRARLCQP